MAKEELSDRAAKDPEEVALWLKEIERHVMPLRFGRIIVNVYRNEITGISVTSDIQKHEREARAEPPAPASES